MKKILVFIICLLTVCQSSYVQVNDNGQRNEMMSKISMDLVPNTTTYPDLSVDIENSRDIMILSGNEYDYRLLINKNGKWEEVKRKPYENFDIAYSYESGKKRRMIFHLESDYGKLKKGKYRLIKEFFIDNKNTPNHEFELSIDFYI